MKSASARRLTYISSPSYARSQYQELIRQRGSIFVLEKKKEERNKKKKKRWLPLPPQQFLGCADPILFIPCEALTPGPSSPRDRGSERAVGLSEKGNGGQDGSRWRRGRRLVNKATPPPSRFSQSPKPVLVEVSTEDGAHISSKPGRGRRTLSLQSNSSGVLSYPINTVPPLQIKKIQAWIVFIMHFFHLSASSIGSRLRSAVSLGSLNQDLMGIALSGGQKNSETQTQTHVFFLCCSVLFQKRGH